jgi:hypothetical protein
MNYKGQASVPPAKQLCILAREFRSTRDLQQRVSIAKAYAEAVNQLIDSNKWRSIPPLEDQLPDEWMPDAFFTHWGLRLPEREPGKTTNRCGDAE